MMDFLKELGNSPKSDGTWCMFALSTYEQQFKLLSTIQATFYNILGKVNS